MTEAMHVIDNLIRNAVEEDDKELLRNVNLLLDLEKEKKMWKERADGMWVLKHKYLKRNTKLKKALKYISKIEQPDGGYVSRLDIAIATAKQALEDTE
ncbi:hypothetical protein [Terrihalobacillus insolitus]|uniref:hypothetical protein n=1 Tax=Terrihalobacillus insolitus TaxID=2950438 RepID=UPI0023402786|nr:hypothetical protein [Terrihalobacillus insolitus]MDC3414285.1 hypothetical protein [Terrihalobacillus insolitus]